MIFLQGEGEFEVMILVHRNREEHGGGLPPSVRPVRSPVEDN